MTYCKTAGVFRKGSAVGLCRHITVSGPVRCTRHPKAGICEHQTDRKPEAQQ